MQQPRGNDHTAENRPVWEAPHPERMTPKLGIFFWGAVLSLSAAWSCSAKDDQSMRPRATAEETTEPLTCSGISPGVALARLLTRTQYDNTVRDLLGDTSQPASEFPVEHEVGGFENNAETHQASPLLIEKHMLAASRLAADAASTRLETIAPCAAADQALELGCGQSFITEFGQRAFRRPLQPDEAASFERLFVDTYASEGYGEAVQSVLQAMLLSPQFLYRIEGMPSGEPEAGPVPLGPYELASRLSYFLYNSMPDGALLQAAATSELETAEQVQAQAERMVEDPKAKQMVSDFHRQWLSLDSLPALARTGEVEDAAPLGADWQKSLELYLDSNFWSDSGEIGQLFSSDVVFVNQRLAGLYGVTPPTGEEFVAVSQPDTRFGLLTQPALMALLSHTDQSSPVQRGVFVREHILCEAIPDPPPNVDDTPPDPDPNATTRERFAVHTQAPACAGCHSLIDPIGFAFEAYDWLGRYRSQENGVVVDTTGEIIGSADPSINGFVSGAADVSARVAQSQRTQDCLITQWFRYAMGRIETREDACSLEQLKAGVANANGNLRQLLIHLTLTDAFRYRIPLDLEAQP